jgi:very-short-patch-repair endonuclease
VGEDNNLFHLFPELAKEWHPTKNGELTPKQVTSKSDKKVWWLCSRGHSHESIVKNRTLNKSNCPDCSNQSSEPEIRILCELKWLFDEVNSRYKVDGVEIDIFLPNLNLGIEYDGKYWHKDNDVKDLEKNKFLLSKGISLIRVRQFPLKPISENDLLVSIVRSLEKTDLDEILKKIMPFVGSNTKEKINTYLLKSSFVNDELFKVYRSYFPSPFPEKSLLETHPLFAQEWDYDKNHPLTPENFSFGSANKIWWLCSKGHSYERSLNRRTSQGTICPYCSGKRVGEDNNLLILFPEVAKEWHPTMNNKLKPKDFTSKSSKKVWWICSIGHSWDTTIYHRTRKEKPTGCPYCSGRKTLNYDLFN